jgi:cell division protease FtsH
MGEQHVFLGREITQDRDVGEETLDRADQAVRRLVTAAYERAETLLNENREKLDQLADVLMTEETIGMDKIIEILGTAPVPAAAPEPAAIAEGIGQ